MAWKIIEQSMGDFKVVFWKEASPLLARFLDRFGVWGPITLAAVFIGAFLAGVLAHGYSYS
jgi:hypothetical protein